jgi:hypothetical protein
MMLRWRRRPTREKLKARKERDEALAMFGEWRYTRSWPNKPTWNDYKFEYFEEALRLFTKRFETASAACYI